MFQYSTIQSAQGAACIELSLGTSPARIFTCSDGMISFGIANVASRASPRHTLLTPPRSRLPGSQGQDLLRRAHRDVRHVHAAVRAVSGRMCGGHRHWEALDHAAASVPAALPNFILSRSLFHWIQAWFFLSFLAFDVARAVAAGPDRCDPKHRPAPGCPRLQ